MCLTWLYRVSFTVKIFVFPWLLSSVRSVAQSCPTLCDPMDCSTPGLPVHHQLLEFTQTHLHWVGDAIQPSLPLSSPSPPAFNLSQHRGLFKWVSSPHQVARVLEFHMHVSPLFWISFPFRSPLSLSSTACAIPKDSQTEWRKSERQIPFVWGI